MRTDGTRHGIRSAALIAALLLLCGCTLSNALRQDDYYSVWGRGPTPPRTIFFATDREPSGGNFGLQWGASLSCGRAAIAIPALWSSGPVPVTQSQTCDKGAALAQFAGEVAQAAHGQHCGGVLIFVHGANTTFRTAMMQGAQLSLDTAWPCATLVFSWSSEGKFDRYLSDIEHSGFAVPMLTALVHELTVTGLKVDILAHSVGGRVALSAVGAACSEPAALVDQLLLAAPDVGAEPGNDDFGHLLRRTRACTHHTTLYASDYDLALITSRSVHGDIPRAGQVPQADLQYPGIDVIDTTLAPGDPSGHGYLTLSYEMDGDMMWALAGASLQSRAKSPASTLTCTDWNGGACVDGKGRYALAVAPQRRPDLGTRLVRRIWPLILPVE
jgi:esterase/lipase superfamily enzyme